MKIRLLLPLIALFAAPLFAQEEPKPAELSEEQIKELVAKMTEGMKFQQGEITLKNGLAKINVPEQLRYLDSKDADRVLTGIWGNPPGSDTLGMLVPANFNPVGDDSWGVVITYEESGYVKDDEAGKINYDDLLKEMQEATREDSKEREKAGYGSIELVGWAAPPRYDQAAKKMYWAKELKFDGADQNTLNYGIRVLGRRGVLVLNAVAVMPQLQQIEAVTPTILSAVDFQEGHRYADFNASTDKVATYGLAGLVAGGVLAKTGLFAKIGVLVAKFAKIFIIAGAAIVGLLAKILGKKNAA